VSVFGRYAQYYDLLYRDKDYQAETDFIAALLARHAPKAKDLCELGCGTGQHAALLAAKGHNVHGVDFSDSMLEAARARAASLPPALGGKLKFSGGDVCDVQLGGDFDAVLSLFHVVSYQTSNARLTQMFDNAAAHVRPGGVFLFDYWYGPAVLSQRPATRVKRMESDAIAVTRLAESDLHINESVVDVNYHIFIRDKADETVEELRETHKMRYLFPSDIDFLAQRAGFKVLESCEWLTGAAPGADTWGVCSVLGR
jgi:SAM-dependent methyltransferase